MSCLPSRLQGGCGRFAVAADEEKLMETMRPSFSQDEALLVFRHGVSPRKCGYPDATCKSFRLMKQKVKADLFFPVRLEALAQKWSRHVLYVPDVCCAASLYIKHPQCHLQVWHTGKVTAIAENFEAGKEAIRRVYSLLREFSL